MCACVMECDTHTDNIMWYFCQGEEILSQVSTVTNDSEEEDGDAVPVDEDEESDVVGDTQY